MLILNLNKKSEVALHKQVFMHIKDFIDKGILIPGSQLPPTRVFAEKHGLSRTTVLKAYEELWALGYIESRPGSYSIVRRKMPNINLNQRSERSLINWNNVISQPSREVYETVALYPKPLSSKACEDMIDMTSLNLDPQILPIDDFKRCLNTVINNDPEIFNYGPMEGYFPLREFIASRMQSHGISVTPEDILITNGTQSSIDLSLKMLTQPGYPIITESPTYFYALPLIRFYKTDLIPIQMNENGLNILQLEQVLTTCRPSFIYTIPNFQNPSSITMIPEVRERLLEISERHKIPIVEDAFEEEMKYFGKVPLSIKSMDKNQIVVYMSSFSKVLFPGIRIGWIAADKELIQRAAAMKKITDLTSNSVIQAALYEFCRRGYYDLHIKRMHRIYKKRMQVVLKALKNELSMGQVSWHEPLGGYLIWLKLSGLNISENEIHNIIEKYKIQVSRGSLFFIEKPENHFIRLSISRLNEEQILEGVRRLKNALEEIYLRKA